MEYLPPSLSESSEYLRLTDIKRDLNQAREELVNLRNEIKTSDFQNDQIKASESQKRIPGELLPTKVAETGGSQPEQPNQSDKNQESHTQTQISFGRPNNTSSKSLYENELKPAENQNKQKIFSFGRRPHPEYKKSSSEYETNVYFPKDSESAQISARDENNNDSFVEIGNNRGGSPSPDNIQYSANFGSKINEEDYLYDQGKFGQHLIYDELEENEQEEYLEQNYIPPYAAESPGPYSQDYVYGTSNDEADNARYSEAANSPQKGQELVRIESNNGYDWENLNQLMREAKDLLKPLEERDSARERDSLMRLGRTEEPEAEQSPKVWVGQSQGILQKEAKRSDEPKEKISKKIEEPENAKISDNPVKQKTQKIDGPKGEKEQVIKIPEEKSYNQKVTAKNAELAQETQPKQYQQLQQDTKPKNEPNPTPIFSSQETQREKNTEKFSQEQIEKNISQLQQLLAQTQQLIEKQKLESKESVLSRGSFKKEYFDSPYQNFGITQDDQSYFNTHSPYETKENGKKLYEPKIESPVAKRLKKMIFEAEELKNKIKAPIISDQAPFSTFY